MAIPFHKAVSSIESIKNTIENDSHTYRWFVKFISHPTIKSRLQNSPGTPDIYRSLQKIELYKQFLFSGLLLLCGILFFMDQKVLILFGLPAVIGIINLSTAHKKQVAKISCALLEMDREATKLENQTLYQMCENYGTSLNIPTLVDIIARQDDILRKTFIYTCVLTGLIYPLDFWHNWIILLGSVLLIQAAINTPLVFDHLK